MGRRNGRRTAVRCVGLRGSAGTGNNQLITDLDRRQSADVYKDADGRTSHNHTSHQHEDLPGCCRSTRRLCHRSGIQTSFLLSLYLLHFVNVFHKCSEKNHAKTVQVVLKLKKSTSLLRTDFCK